MEKITTIGLDLAKSVFQVHGVAEDGRVVTRRALRRSQLLEFFRGIEPCLVGLEACASTHHWANVIGQFGHMVRLMPPANVKAYVKRNSTDAADAEAICEAVTRPTMRFVPIKSPEDQAAGMVLKTRELFVRQRTQMANAMRAHMSELGIIPRPAWPVSPNSSLFYATTMMPAFHQQLDLHSLRWPSRSRN
jgi:transposase